MAGDTHNVRLHTRLALSVLGMTLAFVGLCAAGARWDKDRFVQRQLATWRKVNTSHQMTGGFLDFEDRMLAEVIPGCDFSDRGVFFSGSSDVKVSIMPWRLNAPQRDKVFNFGISSLRHSEQLQFFEYLRRYWNFGSARGGTVVLGLSYINSAGYPADETPYFPSLWRRHGMYLYSRETGVSRRFCGGALRPLICERMRIQSFLNRIAYPRLPRWLYLTRFAGNLTLPRQFEPKEFSRYWIDYMGKDWRSEMDRQLESLDRLIVRLKAWGVQVQCYFTPRISAHATLPFPARYQERVRAILSEHGIEPADLSALVEDELFVDSTHTNEKGQTIYHERLVKLIAPSLNSIIRGESSR